MTTLDVTAPGNSGAVTNCCTLSIAAVDRADDLIDRARAILDLLFLSEDNLNEARRYTLQTAVGTILEDLDELQALLHAGEREGSA